MGVIASDCPHCGASFVVLNCIAASIHPRNPKRYRALFSCNRCFGPFAAVVEHERDHFDPMKIEGDLKAAGFQVAYRTPRAVDPKAPRHTPDAAAKRFIEAEDSFIRQKWTSAVSMYRSTLDIATKNVATTLLPKAVGMNLFARIEALASAHILTEAMREWAHQVRGAGNEALHEEQEMNEEDAVQMRLFTETFLQYAYELPGEVEKRKAQTTATA